MTDLVATVILGALGLALLVVLVGLGAFDRFRPYRRLLGGHWEEWGPGFMEPTWWIEFPDGRCSGSRDRVGHRRRLRCEDYPHAR